MKERNADVQRQFLTAFDNPNGELVLKYLERYSHLNFPNYNNINATYSKIGEQTIVEHIRMIIKKGKERGE